jgi:hypothetical protein
VSAVVPLVWRTDISSVTRRVWTILVIGVLAIVASGAFAVAGGRSTSTIGPSPHWGLYSAESWNAATTKFERRGFSRASVHVVTGTKLMSTGQPFALLGARAASGRQCFAVARGTALGPTICRISQPLVVFTARDVCAPCSPGRSPLKTIAVLSLVRRDVHGVSMIDHGRESGMVISPAGDGIYAFNTGAYRNDILRARGEGNTILAETLLRRP